MTVVADVLKGFVIAVASNTERVVRVVNKCPQRQMDVFKFQIRRKIRT